MLRKLCMPVLSMSLLLVSHIALSAVPDKSREGEPKPAPANWAHIVIKGNYPEGSQVPGLLGEVTESLSAGLARLEKAADDEALAGVILKINGPTIGWAKLNEFRESIAQVRAKGKKVYAWLDNGSTMDYLLATPCDEVVMPESAVLMLLGLRAEVNFYKNLLDMLQVKAEILRVGEYKSAAEPFTRTEMSPEFREELEAILDDYYSQIVEMVAKGQKLDATKVKEAIDSGPHTAMEAKQLGLIDRIAYESDLEEFIKKQSGNEDLKITRKYGKKKIDTDFSGFAGMVKFMNLLMGVQPSQRRSFLPKIAVIHATGAITSGKSQSDLFGGSILGSDTIIKAIKKANDDSRVKAIVLRVDSPGGSALASDLMWQALEKVDKPVVASMGDVAASGGYYIAMGADHIFAEPGTLTGSIGVVGGKLAFDGLFRKIGISTSVVSRGKNTGAMSALAGYSDSERAAMVKLLNSIYDQFTKKAARGRKMEHVTLEKLARGRVYTGKMAVKNGLVDELGTLENAVVHAKKLAGMKEDALIDRLILPKPISPFEQLFGPVDPDAASKVRQPNTLLEDITYLSPELSEQLKMLNIINLLSRESRLTLMPFRLKVK